MTDTPFDFDQMSNEEFAYTFDAMQDVADRWDITMNEAEAFLEQAGYFATERYREIAEYSSPTEPDEA